MTKEIVLHLSFIDITLINIAVGVVLGSFPLIASFVLKNRKQGFYGFVASIIGGAILGVFLAYPIAAVFTWLILRKPVIASAADNIAASPSTFDSSNTDAAD